MILSTVRLAISARHLPEVLRTLRVLEGHATARAGCAGLWVLQSVTNPEELTICDHWLTREDFDAHVCSAEYRLLLAVIDQSVTPPDISFDDLGHIGGLDLVHALRNPRQSTEKDEQVSNEGRAASDVATSQRDQQGEDV